MKMGGVERECTSRRRPRSYQVVGAPGAPGASRGRRGRSRPGPGGQGGGVRTTRGDARGDSLDGGRGRPAAPLLVPLGLDEGDVAAGGFAARRST